jgi:hypothetical protein
VHVEGGVTDRHRDGQGIVDVDTEFFEAFPTDGLARQLARLDMTADEVPAVGIRLTHWVAMRHQHETVAHKCSGCDLNPGDHGGILGANADTSPSARTPHAAAAVGATVSLARGHDLAWHCFTRQILSADKRHYVNLAVLPAVLPCQRSSASRTSRRLTIAAHHAKWPSRPETL